MSAKSVWIWVLMVFGPLAYKVVELVIEYIASL